LLNPGRDSNEYTPVEESIENRGFSKLGGRGWKVCLCEIPSLSANRNFAF